MHLQENTFFDLDTVKVTLNVAQYPLHHVIYSATKFEVAMPNGLGRDTFTRNKTNGQQTDFSTKYTLFFLRKKTGIISDHTLISTLYIIDLLHIMYY